MDDRSFDCLARLLGEARNRRTGLKAMVGGLLGAGGLAALDVEADAKRRKKNKKKKTCKPACGSGYECVKAGRKRECVCPSGVACGVACCAAGQSCRDGACADGPAPGACIAPGEPCKNVGRDCCDGRVCASGNGGDGDIACHSPKTGPCRTSADCVYAMSCQGGRCLPPPPAEGLGVACDATAQQLCASSGATCTAYTGAGAPGGTYCTLGLRKVCTGNPQCTCYKCWYVRDGAVQGREGRSSTNTMACCHPPGEACTVDQDCCSGLDCVNGTCGGSLCVPEGGKSADGACCAGLSVQAGVCTGGGGTTCGPSTCPDGCCLNGQCQTGTADGSCGKNGAPCTACGGATPACGADKVCVQCTTANATACTGSTPACSDVNVCVQCTEANTAACTGTTPYCSSGNICGECNVQAQCTNQALPYCDSTGTCVLTCAATFGPATTSVGAPVGITIDNSRPGAEVFVVNYGASDVSFFNKADASLVRTGTGWGGQMLQGSARTSDGKLLVAGYSDINPVGEYDPAKYPQVWEADTSSAATLGNKGPSYAGPRAGLIGLYQPYGLFFETDNTYGTAGTLWMTGLVRATWDVIAKFKPGTDTRTEIMQANVCGQQGAGFNPSLSRKAREIVRDPATGLLWIACEDNGKIFAYDPSGWQPITELNNCTNCPWDAVPTPKYTKDQSKAFGISLVGSKMYVSSREANGKLYRYEVSGGAANPTLTTTCVYDASTLGEPTGIDWDSAGKRLWINSWTTASPAVTNNTTAAKVT